MTTLLRQRGFVSGNVGAGILFVLLIVFVIWFLSASSVKQRVERVCRPAYWFGNLWVSVAELGGRPEGVSAMTKMRDDLDYGCRHVIWKQFYYEDWLRARAAAQHKSINNGNAEAGRK